MMIDLEKEKIDLIDRKINELQKWLDSRPSASMDCQINLWPVVRRRISELQELRNKNNPSYKIIADKTIESQLSFLNDMEDNDRP